MPMPASQCLTAASMVSHCGAGCLPATMTLTRSQLRRQWSVTAEQRVGVGRQIDADDVGLLVDDVVDEARVLMAEAVVILPPHMRGEQVIQRGDRPAPGQCRA